MKLLGDGIEAARVKRVTARQPFCGQPSALEKAKTFVGKGKPIVILMKTVMGAGVDFMEGHHSILRNMMMGMKMRDIFDKEIGNAC